jgi:hypothetical protein
MKNFIYVVCISWLLVGCSENFLLDVEPVKELTQETITPPCDWKDTAVVGDPFDQMGRWVSTDVSESFDYDEVIVRWGSSSNTLIFKYNNRFGLQALQNSVIDYSEQQYQLTMRLRFGSSSLPSFQPVYGKLYVENDKENKQVTFTWCDIELKHPTSSFSYTSYGSVTVDYE